MQGQFTNRLGQKIEVSIGGVGGTIGADGLYFTDDPVEITSQVSDTLDVRFTSQATIRLLTNGFIDGLFASGYRDRPVTITRDGEVVFSGFVEPQTYSQPFNDELDELELSCIDKLIALDYAKYKAGIPYGTAKSGAAQKTLGAILSGLLSPLGSVSYHDTPTLKDGTTVWEGLTISEQLFMGDTEDDVWSEGDVVDEILRYLGLHVVQVGEDFHVFRWGSQGSGGVALTGKTAMDGGTSISIGEVFSRVILTCDVKNMETVVDSPVDDDLIEPAYDMYQKYMTEYSADGEGNTAIDAFDAMTHGRTTGYGEGSITDWFVQVMRNPSWKTSCPSVDGKTHQEAVPNWLANHPGAALLSLGKVKKNTAGKDNAPTSSVSMTNYLCISINGNGSKDMSSYYPDADDLKAAMPYAEYSGTAASGSFSPADDSTINYIVISGSVVLNPLMGMTDIYPNIRDYKGGKFPTLAGIQRFWHTTPPSRNNGDGRYYTRRYYKADTPHSDIEDNDEAGITGGSVDGYQLGGFTPFTDEGPREYEFKYSAVGERKEGEDHISKVSVIQCMLVIGDKCVVETGTQGQPSDFKWQTFKQRSECKDEDEYYQQSFSIGFDPKIGDFLIGTEFDIQNNVDYTMNIDAKGTAIPIRRSDGVSGDVRFTILGPVNTIWSEVTRRHPTWFRHTKWTETDRPLLSRVSNIMLKEFTIEVKSNNGLTNNRKDCDIVYLSDTSDSSVNDKDITFRISSALTTEECANLGVTDSPRLSTPTEVSTQLGVQQIAVGGVLAKAEQHYVSAAYNEYHTPHMLMEHCIEDVGGLVSQWNTYTHPCTSRAFLVMGIDRSLEEGSATLHLKER